MIVAGQLFFDLDEDGIFDGGDKPIAYERLILARDAQGLAYATYTNAVGQFAFPPVPPARYLLYLRTRENNAPLQVIEGQSQQRVEVTLSLPVRGRVHIPYVVW